MKILHVIHQDPRKPSGGSETYCRHLIREQAHHGNQVAVFFRKYGDGQEPIFAEDDNGIAYFSTDLNALPSAKSRFQYHNSYANEEVARLFNGVLSAFSPDIVHVHHLITLSIEIIHSCRHRQIPIVATLHDYWYFCHRITLTFPDGSPCSGPSTGLRCRRCGKDRYNTFPGFLLQPGQAVASVKRNKRLLQALNECDRIYAPSHSLLSRYEQQGVKSEKLIHRPYGIPKKTLPHYDKSRSVRMTVGYIGQMAPHKGINVLIDAFATLPMDKFELRVYGDGEVEYIEKLRKSSKNVPVSFMSSFQPDDLSQVLNSINILVVPSLWEENSPLVVHEASAHKVPVIASNIGGLPEIVSELNGGLLFPPGDAIALAKAIKSMRNKILNMKDFSQNIRMIRSINIDARDIMSDYETLVDVSD